MARRPSDPRYARQTLVPGWDQERLTRAKVIVMGIGALGNAACQALALAGVGRMLLCDMDRVEVSNLPRSPLFRIDDVGRYKVDAALAALQSLAPGIDVDARAGDLKHAVGLAELRDADLVLSCLDSRAARRELASRCGLVGAPLLDAATGDWSGEIRPFLNPDGPCYACLYGAVTSADQRLQLSCADVGPEPEQGATAPLSLWIGNQMALLATRHLLGLPVPVDIIETDAASCQTRAVAIARDPSCPYHHRLPMARPLPITHRATVARLLKELPGGAAPVAWYAFECTPRSFVIGDAAAGHPDASAAGEAGIRTPCEGPNRTSIELSQAPGNRPLALLGVAPREILAVRCADGIQCVELA